MIQENGPTIEVATPPEFPKGMPGIWSPYKTQNFATKFEILQPLINLDGFYGRQAAKSKITGVSDTGRESIESNWFAAENNETESILFYAFAIPENVETLFNLAAAFNKLQDTTSHIHVAMVNIEQFTNITI
ncbi:hypothetical protein [Flavobacterium sp. BFFFF1]|uniref:hypothetical protein n=1 Tax=Flavobacterium sp. BFFFF1 TaxID=2015557 RepID=UPI0025BBDCED|nr:hypothetical protein [Flavobacterium sp. BFFFF1]